MKHIKILLALLILVSLFGCERDDICAATTATTPHLIIKFYNINNRTQLKKPNKLSVTAENDPKFIVKEVTLDSILLPLRIDALNAVNTSRFVLTQNTGNDPNTVSNSDTIEVTYTPELIYVSRACGYKTVFNDLVVSRETDSINWIIDIEVIQTTINNEDAAHINIYH